MIIAGVDIGNSTTEICIGQMDTNGTMRFLSDYSLETTGTKGTIRNIDGILEGLEQACVLANISVSSIREIRLNEAAPVISDTAMETITETIITDSTMIGHNPDTPAGEGLGIGETFLFEDLLTKSIPKDRDLIIVATGRYNFEEIANKVNLCVVHGICIKGIILEKDEAVLVFNRLKQKVPVIDEINQINKVPMGVLTAIEVAIKGNSITNLSNPFGLAKIFDFDNQRAKEVVPIAKSLSGLSSAVVFRTKKGSVNTKKIEAGQLKFYYLSSASKSIGVDVGAKAIREFMSENSDYQSIEGEAKTHIGNMFDKIKDELVQSSQTAKNDVQIRDILAIDTYVPYAVKGALSGEVSMEKAVGIAAMVQTDKLPMGNIATKLSEIIGIKTTVAGIEGVMATLGTLTTKGVALPLAVLDLGGGSTDGSYLSTEGSIRTIHFAGAGNFVSMMINKELGLENLSLAETIKKYPLAQVESLFHIRHENGMVEFFEKPLSPRVFGKVVAVKGHKYIPLESKHKMQHIIDVRRRVKEEVFISNAERALKRVAPEGNIKLLKSILLIGGSALDFEIPDMLVKHLSIYNVVVGRAEVRGNLGPRGAVATGLVLSRLEERT